MDRVRNHRNLSTKKRFREVCFQPLKEVFLLAARSVCVHTFLKTTQPSQKNCPSFLLRVFKLIIDHWYELSLNTQKRTQPAYLQYVPKKLVRQHLYHYTWSYLFGTRWPAAYQASLVEPCFVFWRVWSSQNTHGETKRTWYAAEAYQKGTIRYLPYPNSAHSYSNSHSIVSVWMFKYLSTQLASVFQFSFGENVFCTFFDCKTPAKS